MDATSGCGRAQGAPSAAVPPGPPRWSTAASTSICRKCARLVGSCTTNPPARSLRWRRTLFEKLRTPGTPPAPPPDHGEFSKQTNAAEGRAEHVHAGDRRRSPVLSRGWHQFGRNTLHPSGRAGRPRTGVDRGGGSADMLLPGLPASRSPHPWSNRRRTASQRLRSAPGLFSDAVGITCFLLLCSSV